jgi:hypothetical protein
MSIEVIRPTCDQVSQVNDESVGKKLRCNGCQIPLAKSTNLLKIGRIFAFVLWIFSTAPAIAEYPALKSAMDPSLEQAAEAAKGKRTLVFVFDATQDPPSWRLRGALQTEVVAGLKAREVDAIDIEREPSCSWLSSKDKLPATADVTRWRKGTAFDALVIGHLQQKRAGMELKLSVHNRAPARTKIMPAVRLDDKMLTIAENTPPLNQQVVDFVRKQLGQAIASGECSAAAEEALKNAGAKKPGIYHWGRQLGDQEAWLPGDVIQFEGAKFAGENGNVYRSCPHHTAIIEEVLSPQVVRVLHQNFGTAGKTISREQMNFDQLTAGSVVFFRPSDGSSPLPISLLPRRRTPARVVKDSSGRIDLLKTIDPHLDSVHGMWNTWQGYLNCHPEYFARLQIPVDVPETYVLQATVKRDYQTDSFGFGLVVGGRQVMLQLDSYDGEYVGLHFVDGKDAKSNETSQRVKLLPMNTAVKLEVRVTPRSIELLVDGKSTLKWEGDPTGLSLDPAWKVPRQDWLFLTEWFSSFQISELTLTQGK